MPKNVLNKLNKCFTVYILDSKSFGGQTSKNVRDVQKLALGRTSVSWCALACFICCLVLKLIGYDPNI